MNIGAPGALWIGAGRSLRNWRLLLIFYAMNLVFAAVLALPFADALMKSVSGSLAGSDLLGGFSYRWYTEFVHANGAYFSSLVPQIVLLFVVYVILEAFFAGGFYSAFADGRRAKTSAFFSNGAARFFPIMAVTLAELAALFLLYELDAVWAGAGKEAARTAITGSQVLLADLIRYGVVILVFVFVNMTADFIRAALAVDDDAFLGKISRGFFFVVKHPLSSIGVYAGAALFSGAVITGWYFLNSTVHAVNETAVLLEMTIGQIFVLLRIFSKLIFYAGEAALYKENQIEVIKVKPEMLE